MKISIITATYNAAESIYKTLYSVSIQSFIDYEIIIVDGNSNDNTLKIANSFNEKIANLIILSERDRGVYDAMNKGIQLSHGDYLFFLNAGDILANADILAKISLHLCDNKIVYGNALTNRGSVIMPYRTGRFTKYRLAYTNICHQTIFYPREALINRGYNLKYRLFADWENNYYLWNNYLFFYVNIDIVIYEGGGISDTQTDKSFANDQKTLVFKYLGIDALFFIFIRKIHQGISYIISKVKKIDNV